VHGKSAKATNRAEHPFEFIDAPAGWMKWLKMTAVDSGDVFPHARGEAMEQQFAVTSADVSGPSRTESQEVPVEGPRRRLRSKTASDSPSFSAPESEHNEPTASARASAVGICEVTSKALLAHLDGVGAGSRAGPSISPAISTGPLADSAAINLRDPVRFVQNDWENTMHLYHHGERTVSS